jgi:hypothetical protein
MIYTQFFIFSAEIVLDKSKTSIAPPPRPRQAGASLPPSPVRLQPTCEQRSQADTGHTNAVAKENMNEDVEGNNGNANTEDDNADVDENADVDADADVDLDVDDNADVDADADVTQTWTWTTTRMWTRT